MNTVTRVSAFALILCVLLSTVNGKYTNSSLHEPHARHIEGVIARFWAEDIVGQSRVVVNSAPGVVWPKFEFSSNVVIATLIGFLGAAMASPAGIGGGPIFVPTFNLLLGYDTKSAIALAKAMVFGVAFSSLFFNIGRRHPLIKNKALIDYDLAVLLQPTLLLGISIGVMINVVFPGWLLSLVLCMGLFVVSFRTFRKGITMWKKEDNDAKLLKTSQSVREDTALEKVPETDEEEIPMVKLIKWHYIGVMTFVWIVYCIIQVVSISVQRCGIGFWLVTLSQILVSALACLWAASQRSPDPEASKLEEGVSPPKVDSIVLYAPFVTLLAGIVAGLLGVGGGIVMGPVFLEMGFHPQVATATSTFMILFSSSLSVLEYYLLGRIPLNVAIFFIFVAIAAAFFGNLVVTSIVKKTNKASIVIFVLAFFVGICGLLIFILGGEKTIIDLTTGAYMGFFGFCSLIA